MRLPEADRVVFAAGPELLGDVVLHARGSRLLVMPLTKAEGGAFAERISVGRALNCDVVIRDESVSKLHAYFRIVTATTAEVTDAKSANRTLVNAKIVEPGQTARVAVCDTLIFGRVALQFMDAASTYDWI